MSAAKSTAVPSSGELLGSHVPPVSAVAAVIAALVLEVARREGAAGTAASGVVCSAAATATGGGTRSHVGGRRRSSESAGRGRLGDGRGRGLLLHLLDQLDGDSGVAGLVAVDGIRHPVCNHCIQNLQLGGTVLAGQEVAGVDDLAGRELRLDQPADLVQFVHQAEDDLSGSVILHDKVGAVTVLEATRYQNVPREWSDDVDQPRTADRNDLAQSVEHRLQKDGGGDGQVAVHVVLVVNRALRDRRKLTG